MEKKMESLTWIEFKKHLELYPELQLKFIYNKDQTIFPNFHITEFKLATIEAVDCGGNLDSWKEIILQVLEPKEKEENESLNLGKIGNIYSKVSKAITIPDDAILRIEFGNQTTAMRQFFVSDAQIDGSAFVIHLKDGATECKAKTSCGLPKVDDMLSLQVAGIQKIESTPSSCCQPRNAKKETAGCC
ncbi:hypothetical protein LEP1GSC202_0492 [Leptospira yanagawae serovar Saopaulo str. Sao Paulo = ATCC 700523]|uniref:Uncharacterized protein n=1 Tax=Leptospira yanagawae serovar Saopaulo str. Sao Paulo = ATCC 700523 TaxID=1249483 RepID=A0A5E8HJZ6_9LEPT|nr:DUF6428 family protein [Leptospira yanagawae]EOQ90146.1 hypothetical protein LEP1GSC202_0492 [Leptospira yanagawae serovar Saopaulo str. Sao Paulo = ATCC 700523]